MKNMPLEPEGFGLEITKGVEAFYNAEIMGIDKALEAVKLAHSRNKNSSYVIYADKIAEMTRECVWHTKLHGEPSPFLETVEIFVLSDGTALAVLDTVALRRFESEEAAVACMKYNGYS